MNWLDRMNNALDFIEDHLDEEIDYDQIASKACCSVSHFQRMFAFLTDIPLSEYVRRRRLTLAAFELQNTDVKIIDLALRYNYNSPISFARAFQNQHGIPPSLARDKGVVLKAYPRISFYITIKGDAAMDYRIIEKGSFTVYGIEGIFTTENGENLKAIPKFWLDTFKDGRYEKLVQSSNHDSTDSLCAVNAICDYRSTEGTTFPYMLCVFLKEGARTDGYTVVEVPASTWAVFKSAEHTQEETSNVFQALIRRVYTEWLPTAKYEKLYGYELELYYTNPKTGKCFCEAWIRVEPK